MEYITGNLVGVSLFQVYIWLNLFRQVQCPSRTSEQSYPRVGRLKSLELGYTGLDNAELTKLLPTIGQLEELHYLGLSGNRLHKDIVDVLTQVSQSEEQIRRMNRMPVQLNSRSTCFLRPIGSVANAYHLSFD